MLECIGGVQTAIAGQKEIMSSGPTSILSTTAMFDGLSTTQLELIHSIGEITDHAAGQIIFHENAQSDELYVILRGRVEILLNPGLVGKMQQAEPVVIVELFRGQVFGEMALVDQGMRTATARVVEEQTRLMAIARDRLMRLCDAYPELGYKLMANLAADLSLKLRNSDLMMRQYQLQLGQQAE